MAILARMLRPTSQRNMAYCSAKASTSTLLGTIDAYQAQTLVLKVRATKALAIASTICRIPQPLLAHRTTLRSTLSVTMGGRYGANQFVVSITPATASEISDDLIITKCGSLVMIVVMPVTRTSTTLRYCS